ncbi:LacI family DNA-binding transcriptional regulator [Deinococcus sp.]|uniref:LacI family DNA-binding transcriptional regulator n=1 Tax=Deinococcus sp. TaxID=47478 RepID=UPI0025D282BD|nr:LacI family DNA-binding transcriptional regulator [Deinococcus sp.]
MSSLKDVANLAQVSLATASRALSRPETVATLTRTRVEGAAHQLGYQPNMLARSLRQRETRTIGLIVADLLNPFHALLAKSVQDTAERHGYVAFLLNSDEQEGKESRAIDTLRGHLPQGLIIVPTSGFARRLGSLPRLPVVELDRVSGAPGVTTVTVDNVGGARMATQHLIDLGHRDIGMIVGQLDISTAVERHRGFLETMRRAGLSYRPDWVLSGHHREDDGHRAARKLLSVPGDRPSALFVGNNEMTVGAVLAARDLGLRLPHDLSIVGFDDSRWAQTMFPALTVISQPTEQLGTLACEHLVRQLAYAHSGNAQLALPARVLNKAAPIGPVRVQLPTELIIRHSTSPPALVFG